MKIPILYQDEHIVVVNKPVGLNTHPDEEADGFDVVSLLKAQLGVTYLGVHHRLDREVSGALVFALQQSANPGLARAFEGRLAEKDYLAIVRGRLPQRTGIIDAPLAKALGGRWRVARPGESGSQAARTRYRVLATGPNQSYTLVRLVLETGRTHQLRIHLAHLGCPIIGDGVYGRPVATIHKDPAAVAIGDPFPRMLLHATRLTFPHPISGEVLRFETESPSSFKLAEESHPLPELALANRLLANGLTALRPSDQAGLGRLLALAAERRTPLTLSEDTTAYRLVNSNGDGLPGITLDRYGSALVLNCYEDGLEAHTPAFKLLSGELARQWPNFSVYAKFRPRQLSNLASQTQKAGKTAQEIVPEQPVVGPNQSELTAQENGLNYLIRPGDGFSPGLFLDMREVRAHLAEWTTGKTVLNCFSYTSAFGLVSAMHGARRAVNLDAGRKVLDWSKLNYTANGLTPDDFDFIEGDVFDWLQRFAKRDQLFDLVLLDPPSYSTVKKTRWMAEKNYNELATLAVKVVEPKGLLIACTNHAGLTRQAFRQQVLRGIEAANRKAEVIGFYHEPELDFPRTANQEAYLKVLVLRLQN